MIKALKRIVQLTGSIEKSNWKVNWLGGYFDRLEPALNTNHGKHSLQCARRFSKRVICCGLTHVFRVIPVRKLIVHLRRHRPRANHAGGNELLDEILKL